MLGRIVLCALVLATSAVSSGLEAGAVEPRTALVIGNATYENAPLRNPLNDAADMAAALQRLGFSVTLLRDADLRTMIGAIDAFSRQLRQGGPGLFYFAGHGVQVQGENYLIPLRARIAREQDIPYEAVPMGRILGGMEDAGNHFNIIILDACRDNPFARQWRSAQRGLAVTQALQGSLIAYATAPGGVAIDGNDRNGLYTTQLLRHIATPSLSVEQLFKRVRAEVVAATGGKQTPWESSSLIGDFSFAGPAMDQARTAESRASQPFAALTPRAGSTQAPQGAREAQPLGAGFDGQWVTDRLTNPFDKNDSFKLTFTFDVKGALVLGSLRKVSTQNRYNLVTGIVEGKIQDGVLSFQTQQTSLLGADRVTYKDFYYGSITNEGIEFTLQSDRPWGFAPQKFTAKRVQQSKP